MSPCVCCVCKKERIVSVQRFPLIRTGYPMGAACQAAWRQHAQSLGGDIYNPARVQMAFKAWLEARKPVSVDAFSKAVAAICARHNIGADWFPWTLQQNRERAS